MSIAERKEEGAVLGARVGKQTPVYLIRADRYFDREHLYGTQEGDHPDNAERFVWFSRVAFEEALAYKIESGADMFLMPSRYEPSGLNQLYSLKYGTMPIVRATGGLKDSIREFDPVEGTGNGFTFQSYYGAALLGAVDRALAAFRRQDHWEKLMRNAMAADHSWDRPAREYLSLYERLLGLSTAQSLRKE